ncbi:MAG: HNH endonuclease [Chitinophagaceae bacterium]|nr:HNH endonuclease [Anaerolineae bacterium]
MPSVSEKLRQQVYDRAKGLCEYCQSQSLIVNDKLEVDHIQPRAAGGNIALENLCLSCRNCNGSKKHFQTGIDPETSNNVTLFNPRAQSWVEHFKWSDDGLYIIGLTSIGRATIQRLDMNRASTIESRAMWVKAGWHPPKS